MARLSLFCEGQTAPSKRIIAEFPGYRKAKRTFAPQLAQEIGLPRIRCRGRLRDGFWG